jgi:hypothetical protein
MFLFVLPGWALLDALERLERIWFLGAVRPRQRGKPCDLPDFISLDLPGKPKPGCAVRLVAPADWAGCTDLESSAFFQRSSTTIATGAGTAENEFVAKFLAGFGNAAGSRPDRWDTVVDH